MRFLVTCGPTYEPLDQVRRLTNFSTGRLGISLANYLFEAGHDVTLLKGYYAVCPDRSSVRPITFTTTDDLLNHFRQASKENYDAIFHAAAVSDFTVATVYKRAPDGRLDPITSGKFSTRDGNLLAELVPTQKIIRHLRGLFSSAKIFGWKYEVEGTADSVSELGRRQIADNLTDFCVLNGPAYGDGFGVLSSGGVLEHCANPEHLFATLLTHVVSAPPGKRRPLKPRPL